MIAWPDFLKKYGISCSISPCMREKCGAAVIFWFRNGNGDVADVVTRIKEKVDAEVIWDDAEGLTGIKIFL